MQLPSEIKNRIGDRSYQLDDVGLSGSQVLLFDDMVLKIQPETEETRAEQRTEMIKNLQEFMEENGDIDCYYAVDDEGNDYKEVYYKPTLMLENPYGDLYQVEEIEECGWFTYENALRILKSKLLSLKLEQEQQKMREIKGELKKIPAIRIFRALWV